ncbi:hypothetical protein D3C85_1050070 [compost metagenome]|uniref:hypothetical protein n=1 Tax=Pseudomonas sp. ACN8 TaxID=1920428 RepID=UPI000BB35F01|nr:hypothetical protein [Pseudomonas sp. ACN8]PBJ23921.1 hypothetical protein BSF44_22840 [Pseudomonas sp. ACN8]
MSSYFYKTNAAPALAAIDAWDAKRAEFDRKREALKDVFGGPGSPMYSGSDSYVGGVKISASRDLDVHWRRPDEYGYRALRHAAKPEKGATKEARAAYKAEHDRLTALWQEHCPDRISKDDVWKALGVDWGSVWLSGGVFFKHDDAIYLNLGFQLKEDGEHIQGATEIVASEFEAARQQVLNQRKAA